MGFLDFLSSDKRAKAREDKTAIDKRMADFQAVVPAGVTVSVETGRGGVFTVYTLHMTGNRSEYPILVSRIAGVLGSLGRLDEVDIRITTGEEAHSVFSLVRISGQNTAPQAIDSLVRGHDTFLALLPHHSLEIVGSYGSFTVSGVSRAQAVDVARDMADGWEAFLATEIALWPLSEIAVHVGEPTEDPDISYTVGIAGTLEGFDDESDDELDDEDPAISLAETREHAQLALAAWRENLGDLAAVGKSRVRRGFAAHLYFTASRFKPRLTVEDLEEYEDDADEGAELVAAIRFHNPQSRIKI